MGGSGCECEHGVSQSRASEEEEEERDTNRVARKGLDEKVTLFW